MINTLKITRFAQFGHILDHFWVYRGLYRPAKGPLKFQKQYLNLQLHFEYWMFVGYIP